MAESLPPEDAAALRHRLLKAMVDVVTEYEGRVDRFLNIEGEIDNADQNVGNNCDDPRAAG